MRFLKLGCMTNLQQFLSFHLCDQIVCFCWCLCWTICKTILSWNMSKIMNASWTSFLSQHRDHLNCLLFCLGKWIVLAAVTRFFASVLMWIFATSPDRSIHNPRRNWHEPKHFMKECSSATVVESTILFYPLAFKINQTSIWHSVLSWSLTRFW